MLRNRQLLPVAGLNESKNSALGPREFANKGWLESLSTMGDVMFSAAPKVSMTRESHNGKTA